MGRSVPELRLGVHFASMDSAAHDLALLFRSHYPLVLCETVEEPRFEALVRGVAADCRMSFASWSASSGLAPSHPADNEDSTDLRRALERIRRSSLEGVWLLKDPQAYLESPQTLRLLREVAQEFSASTRTIVLVGPTLPSKPELEGLQVRFEFALPGLEDLRSLVVETVGRFRATHPHGRFAVGRTEVEGFAADLKGLTIFEAERVLSRAFLEDEAFSPEDREGIRQMKKELVESGGLLSFVAGPEKLDEVGGLARLKHWLETRRTGFFPDAGKPPLDPPRGILLLGVQGCGKSLAAKATAGSWQLPLLALDPSALLAPYIGESERNLREVFRRVGRIAPCVVWIDEIEKAFVSARGSVSDGGVSRRLMGSLLMWLQERRDPVFVVATANSVEELPPELVRKGRFDEIFFVDLPGPAARREIFQVHLSRRGEDASKLDLARLAEASEGFSGAEIEQAVVSALYESRTRGLPLDESTLFVALRTTRPLSAICAEKIGALRQWARERCVFADAPGEI